MTKDKMGRPIFVAGRTYEAKEAFNPVWPQGQKAKCLEVRPYMADLGTGEKIEGGQGMFQLGIDSRWWTASDQFEDATK